MCVEFDRGYGYIDHSSVWNKLGYACGSCLEACWNIVCSAFNVMHKIYISYHSFYVYWINWILSKSSTANALVKISVI